jgi:hypothetical protein
VIPVVAKRIREPKTVRMVFNKSTINEIHPRLIVIEAVSEIVVVSNSGLNIPIPATNGRITSSSIKRGFKGISARGISINGYKKRGRTLLNEYLSRAITVKR